jgi:hypothetical protein
MTPPKDPARRCRAKSRASGWQQCGRAAVIGGTVCIVHGGKAPQVARKARERATLAEALRLDPARSLVDVMTDQVHAMDLLARRAREAQPGDAAQIIDTAERAFRAARDALAAGAVDRRAELDALTIRTWMGIFERALDQTVPPAEIERFRVLVGREIEALTKAGDAVWIEDAEIIEDSAPMIEAP